MEPAIRPPSPTEVIVEDGRTAREFGALLRTVAQRLNRVLRKEAVGTAAPATGTWARGDVVWNGEPGAGGTIGWVCVVAGSPGTWRTFGAIAA